MSALPRPVARVVTPEPVVEGAGVRLRRSLGTRTLDHLETAIGALRVTITDEQVARLDLA